MTLNAVLFDIGDTLWRIPPSIFDREALLPYYERACALLDGSALPPTAAMVDAVGLRLAAARDQFLLGPERGRQPSTAQLVAEGLQTLGLTLPRDRLRRFAETIFEHEVDVARQEPRDPAMAAALEALRSRGLRLACVSNTFHSAAALRRMLEGRGLLSHFEHVVSSADEGFRKPHQRAFMPALGALKVQPAEAVFVGDRLDTDVAGAAGLGMTTVLTHQYRQEDPASAPVRPDHVIERLSDLVPLVDGLLMT